MAAAVPERWTALAASICLLIAARSALAIDLDLDVPFAVPHLEELSEDSPVRELKSYQPPCPKDIFKKYGQCNETDFKARLRYCDELNAILQHSEVKYRDPSNLDSGPQPCLGMGDDNLFDTTQLQEMIEIFQDGGGYRDDDDDDDADDDERSAESPHRRAKRSSKLIKDFKINRWDMPIKYKIDGYLAAYGEKTIKNALREWEKHTCVRFAEIDVDSLPHEQHLVFLPTSSQVCYSYIGKTRTGEEDMSQPIFLSYLCMVKGILEHEIGHALGLIHEHQRPDRDKYVTIVKENVRSSARGLFSTIPNKFIDTRKVPYDYSSNMHYTGVAFSANGNNTIETKDKRFQKTIGQRVELTFWDVLAANMAYCDHICSDVSLVRPCANRGYQDPNNCTRCLCPEGWAGDFCDELATPVKDFCGGHIRIDGTDMSYLQSPNYMSAGNINYYEIGQECNWLISAPEGKRLVLSFEGSLFSVFCYQECLHWVEIRYGDDLGSNGPRFCCYEKPKDVILSTGNRVMVLFRAKDDFPAYHERQGFKLGFRADGDECASQPCYNGGVCTDGIAEYTCSCPWPYTGRRCENAVTSFCSGEPCQNGGTCVIQNGGYYCLCRRPFFGENCELGKDDVIQSWRPAGPRPPPQSTATATTAATTTTTATTTSPTTPTTTTATTTTTTRSTTTTTTTETTVTTRAATTTRPTTTTPLPSTTTKPLPRATEVPASQEDKIDIMFLLDVSSRSGKDLSCYKTFLKKVIKMFHFGQSATRIGLITLARLARTASNLKANWHAAGLIEELERQRLSSADTCDYYNAVWLLLTDSYREANGGRRGVPDVAVIVADNRPSARHLDIYQAIKARAVRRLRDEGVKVYALAVGESANAAELINIAGTERHYYHASGCQDLLREQTVARTYEYIKLLANEARLEMTSTGSTLASSTAATAAAAESTRPALRRGHPATEQATSLLSRILTPTRPPTSRTTPASSAPAQTTGRPSAKNDSLVLPRCWWMQDGPCNEPCGGCGRKRMVFYCMSTSGRKKIHAKLYEPCNSQACPKYCRSGRDSKNRICGTTCCDASYRQVDGVCVKKKP